MLRQIWLRTQTVCEYRYELCVSLKLLTGQLVAIVVVGLNSE